MFYLFCVELVSSYPIKSYNHPKRRNPYAHVALAVKDKFNSSYKDIEDNKFDEVVNYINYLKQNPS